MYRELLREVIAMAALLGERVFTGVFYPPVSHTIHTFLGKSQTVLVMFLTRIIVRILKRAPGISIRLFSRIRNLECRTADILCQLSMRIHRL